MKSSACAGAAPRFRPERGRSRSPELGRSRRGWIGAEAVEQPRPRLEAPRDRVHEVERAAHLACAEVGKKASGELGFAAFQQDPCAPAHSGLLAHDLRLESLPERGHLAKKVIMVLE